MSMLDLQNHANKVSKVTIKNDIPSCIAVTACDVQFLGSKSTDRRRLSCTAKTSTKFMGSNASRGENQANGSFASNSPELYQQHKQTNTTSLSNGEPKPSKETQVHKSNNNNNFLSKKTSSDSKPDTTLESDMHFIVDTFESVEKMTSKEKTKRRRWRRSKDKDETKSKPTESTSAPSRLTKSPKQESENTEVKGILAKGKQFILRRQGAVKHPKTAPPAATASCEREDENEDNWDYQKVVIDGFDPEKFKQANATKKPNDAQTLSSVKPNGDPLVLRIRNTELQELAVPSAYDFTEEQLMNSIEKEFK